MVYVGWVFPIMTTLPKAPVPVAEYVRMSTELQQYSIENQKAAIKEYAAQHGFGVVKTYTDAGRSGIVLKHRTGLSTLLKDVLGGNPGFGAILVYDISRWGRFQDTDEAAHYEFLCKNAGIPVHYCAEQFANDGTLPSSILKALKRTMAAEFSRELGVKVLEGKKRLAELGFRMGALPGYGLRRLLISSDRQPKQKLRTGEYKHLTTDRILLVPGPRKEVQCVREIYKMVLRKGMNMSKIARRLNQAGIPYVGGRRWTCSSVGRTLRNPKYTGCNTWNRSSRKLHTRLVQVPPAEWVVRPGAFAAIIDREKFDHVQAVLRKRAERLSDEQMLNCLRRLLKTKGKLTQNLIAEARNIPNVATYFYRLGNFRHIYELLGYGATPGAFDRSDSRVRTLKFRAELLERIAATFPQNVTFVRLPQKMRSIIRLDDVLDVSLLICPSFKTKKGSLRWKLTPVPSERDRITLLCRLNAENTASHSFYVIPRVDRPKACKLKDNDPWLANDVRLKDLSQFYETATALALRLPKAEHQIPTPQDTKPMRGMRARRRLARKLKEQQDV
jgi:DNA invertase Pin-like site-specific DNA recombinase